MSKKTLVLNAEKPASIRAAVRVLKKGGVVAFPTETVYGLGADAWNPKAVAKIFEAKKRPTFDPIIVHVSSIRQAHSLWKDFPKTAVTLMKKFWPGPLTLVLPKNSKIPDLVTAGLSTVAVRMPKNKIALELLKKFGHPIAAPSANRFGYTSATTAVAVLEDLGGKTRIVSVSRFETVEDRDGVIASGMETGARESYDRLEEYLNVMSEK